MEIYASSHIFLLLFMCTKKTASVTTKMRKITEEENLDLDQHQQLL